MRILVGIIVIIVLAGGLAWFMAGDDANTEIEEEDETVDQLSAEGRVIDTDQAVFDEIDDAIAGLE